LEISRCSALNGSGYSVKLGNTTGGAQAEGVSYRFSIPPGRNTYSLIYHYAVVFQDPNHLEFQQPRLVLEVWNETDDELIDCSSFTFFPVGSPLPGFFNAGMYDSATVWCKDWSAVTINLNDMAGKDIQLFFKTADCTFPRLVDTLTLTANAGADVTSCNNQPVWIGENRKPGVSYSWNPASGLSDPLISNPRASPSVTTNYEVTVRSQGGGCVNRDTVVVTASVIDSSLQVQGKPLVCITSSDSAVLFVQPTDSIQWHLNNSAIAGANQTRYRVQQSGTYYAQMFTNVGCSLSTRQERVVIEVPRPGIIYPTQYAVMNFPAPLQARSFGTIYQWRPSLYLDNPALSNPVFNSPVIGDQVYTINITTAAGCLTVDTQLVNTIQEVKVYVPTAFTPNNDGRNDYLRPIMLGVKELRYFRVYNRWGQIVYNMQSSELGWDGTVKGQVQNTAVYVWMIEAIGLDNRRYFQKGTVALVK